MLCYVNWYLSSCDENVLKLRGTMLFQKSSMRIGMKVSNRSALLLLSPCIHLLPTKKLLFWKKMLCKLVLCRLAKCYDASIFPLAAKFHLEPHDVVRSSVTCKLITVSYTHLTLPTKRIV